MIAIVDGGGGGGRSWRDNFAGEAGLFLGEALPPPASPSLPVDTPPLEGVSVSNHETLDLAMEVWAGI